MPGPGRRPARPVRALTAIVAAVALSFGASACGIVGGGISESKVAKRIAEETELQAIPAAPRKKYADCLAKVVVKHGNKDDVGAYIDGKKDAKDIRGMDDALAKAGVNKCVAQVPRR